MKQFKDFGIAPSKPVMEGDKIKIDRIFNRQITIHGYEIKPSKFERGNGKCLHLQIEIDNQKRVVFTASGVLMETLGMIPKDAFPFTTTIVKDNDRFLLT